MEGSEANGTVLDDWLGRRQLAQELEVSVDTLARWEVARTGPPCIRLGRRVYYRRETVREWLKSLEVRRGAR